MAIFERGGMINRVPLTLETLPDHSSKTLRRLSDEELYEYVAGWKEGTAHWIGGQVELRRRENWVARRALTLSFLALLVSIIALIVGNG